MEEGKKKEKKKYLLEKKVMLQEIRENERGKQLKLDYDTVKTNYEDKLVCNGRDVENGQACHY